MRRDFFVLGAPRYVPPSARRFHARCTRSLGRLPVNVKSRGWSAVASPAQAGADQGVDEVDSVGLQVRAEECVLLRFQEDLFILGLVSLRQARVGAGIRVPQRRVGGHGGLEDAEEQSVEVGDGLRGVSPPYRAGLVVLPRAPFVEVVDPLADVVARDLVRVIRDCQVLEPRSHVVLDESLIVGASVPGYACQQLDVLGGVGREQFLGRTLRIARPLDEPVTFDPARRPLLSVTVDKVAEALCRRLIVEDLALPLAVAGATGAPGDPVGHGAGLARRGLDVRHDDQRTRASWGNRVATDAARRPPRGVPAAQIDSSGGAGGTRTHGRRIMSPLL